MKRFGVLVTGSVFMVAMVASTSSMAEDDSEQVIKYRHAVMKSMGAHNKALSSIVKGKVSYKQHAMMHATALAEAAKTIISLFPEGSDFGETHAKPAVWEKRKAFEKAARDSEMATAEFLKVVSSGDQKAMATGFKKVGQSCKACHKDFREKK